MILLEHPIHRPKAVVRTVVHPTMLSPPLIPVVLANDHAWVNISPRFDEEGSPGLKLPKGV